MQLGSNHLKLKGVLMTPLKFFCWKDCTINLNQACATDNE